jgi:hypothetical protein
MIRAAQYELVARSKGRCVCVVSLLVAAVAWLWIQHLCRAAAYSRQQSICIRVSGLIFVEDVCSILRMPPSWLWPMHCLLCYDSRIRTVFRVSYGRVAVELELPHTCYAATGHVLTQLDTLMCVAMPMLRVLACVL